MPSRPNISCHNEWVVVLGGCLLPPEAKAGHSRRRIWFSGLFKRRHHRHQRSPQETQLDNTATIDVAQIPLVIDSMPSFDFRVPSYVPVGA